MVKQLRDISNEELKKLIDEYMGTLVKISKNMMSVNPTGLQIYDFLQTIHVKFKNNTLELVTARKTLVDVMKNVCEFIPVYEQKLINFTSLSLKLELSHQDFFSEMAEKEEKHKHVGEMTEILKKMENTKNYFYLLLFLQQHIRESIEYDFSTSLKRIPDSKNYDFEDLFSLEGKVRCRDGFVTQGVAMRNAIAHVKYTIIPKNDTFQVIFRNTTDGYDYQAKYTLEEFWTFMNRQNNLYQLFIVIAYCIYLDNLLRHFFRTDNQDILNN